MSALTTTLLGVGVAWAQPGSIALRPVVRVEGERAVTLGDVAMLTGPAAEALSGIVVLSSPGSDWTTLDADAIRGAIDEQAKPVWGHLTLTGGTCRVRAVGVPTTPIDVSPSAPDTSEAGADPTSVRGVIEQRLALALSCNLSDLRLSFDARDTDLLAQTAISRTVDVQPTGFSPRMPVRVAIYEGERIVRIDAIRVGVEVRRSVLVAPSGLDRGSVIDPSHLRVEERWLAPDERPVSPEGAAGMLVRARMAPGAILTARDVEMPLAARRGQTISAHAVGGAVSLQLLARALENGRVGDVIRCESISAPRSAGAARGPARQFLVRLAGPGVGVVVEGREEPRVDNPEASPRSTHDEPANATPAQNGISIQRM